jgi:hypothetical protein
MLEPSWRDILSQGLYEIELSKFTLSRAAGDVFSGAARLRWTPTEGVRVTGTTDGEIDFFGLSYGGPGSFVPKSALFRLDGTSPDGWAVEATDLVLTGKEYKSCQSGIVWDFKCDTIKLQQASSPVGPKPLLRTAIIPIRRMKFWGESEFIDKNPHEIFQSRVGDWMTYETSFGGVYARSRGEILGVDIVGDLDVERFEEALESVRLAFSFIEGRNLRVLGYEANCGSRTIRIIYPKTSTTEKAFPSPMAGALTMSA